MSYGNILPMLTSNEQAPFKLIPSSEYGDSYRAYRVTDPSNNGWVTSTLSPAYLIIDLGDLYKVDKYYLHSLFSTAGSHVSAWEIWVSKDGFNYIKIDSQTISSNQADMLLQFNISPVIVRYFKIECVERFNQYDWNGFRYIEIHGELAPEFKHLIKSNNNILTIQDNEFISVPNTTQQSFETYGLDDLFGLATPSHRTTYIMNADRLEGEGKVFSRKIDPAKWQRMIQKMEVK